MKKKYIIEIDESLKGSVNKVCNITELKSKELEWNFDGDGHYANLFDGCKISFCQFLTGWSKIYINDVEYDELLNKSNSELKQICQEYSDKFLLEMVGNK